MVAFLGDLGLLGNRISVFEAEKVRQSIMSQATEEDIHNDVNTDTEDTVSGGDCITYEQFYSWLRGVAVLYYTSEESSSRKALHLLLTKKIIPLASSWGSFRYSSCVLNGVNGPILHGMNRHLVFLRFWYFHISDEVGCVLVNVYMYTYAVVLMCVIILILSTFACFLNSAKPKNYECCRYMGQSCEE